ncbi:hypothetical protein LXA43DRAFT_1162092 [Ganoderma leucocontextum]|nr:hypothetical protein LXA43DRAFT_1162092 [Ganoderma leucocontextum]
MFFDRSYRWGNYDCRRDSGIATQRTRPVARRDVATKVKMMTSPTVATLSSTDESRPSGSTSVRVVAAFYVDAAPGRASVVPRDELPPPTKPPEWDARSAAASSTAATFDSPISAAEFEHSRGAVRSLDEKLRDIFYPTHAPAPYPRSSASFVVPSCSSPRSMSSFAPPISPPQPAAWCHPPPSPVYPSRPPGQRPTFRTSLIPAESRLLPRYSSAVPDVDARPPSYMVTRWHAMDKCLRRLAYVGAEKDTGTPTTATTAISPLSPDFPGVKPLGFGRSSDEKSGHISIAQDVRLPPGRTPRNSPGPSVSSFRTSVTAASAIQELAPPSLFWREPPSPRNKPLPTPHAPSWKARTGSGFAASSPGGTSSSQPMGRSTFVTSNPSIVTITGQSWRGFETSTRGSSRSASNFSNVFDDTSSLDVPSRSSTAPPPYDWYE